MSQLRIIEDNARSLRFIETKFDKPALLYE